MSDKKDLLSKYGRKSFPPLKKPEQIQETTNAGGKEDYQAVVEMIRANRTPRFRIVNAQGVSFGCSYAHLLDWTLTPPDGLIITTATRLFSIKGKNLELVERLLMEERIKDLYQFDAAKHHPPEKDAAIIEEIDVITQ